MKLRVTSILLMVYLAGFMAWSVPVHSSEAQQVQALHQLLHEFLAGASVNDAAAHRRFWADELIYTSSSGKRFGKQTILQGLEEDATGAQLIYSAEDIQVQLLGDSAVVAFRLLGRDPTGENEEMAFFNTGTFVHKDAGWQAVAWQATRIPPDN